MRIQLHRLWIMAVGLALVSCLRDQPDEPKPDHKGDVPIRISPRLVEDPDWVPTRVPSDITDIDSTALRAGGFGVYAFYTGAQDFIATDDSTDFTTFGRVYNNRQFSYSSGWSAAGTDEYWPTRTGEKLSFFAYAPYNTWHNRITNDGTVLSICYDDFVAQSMTASELSKQRDLLWGTNSSGLAHKNVQKNDFTPKGTVDMHFRHALAKVKFTITGVLSGEESGTHTTGNVSNSDGTPYGETSGAHSNSTNISNNVKTGNEYSEGNVMNRKYYKDYTNTQTQTETESYQQTIYRVRTQSRTSTYSTAGYRYLLDYVKFKGFNRRGTLVLDNPTAYTPYWTNVSPFTGDTPEYQLTSSTVLTDSLTKVAVASIRDNFAKYTGILQRPRDLMSGYYLYAVPKMVINPADQIDVSLQYQKVRVEGRVNATETREIIQVAQRNVTRTRSRERVSNTIKVQGTSSWGGRTYTDPEIGDYTFNTEWESIPWDDWTDWNFPTYNYTDQSYGSWAETSASLSNNPTVAYEDDPQELEGKIVTSFQGGRAYDINLIVAGDKIDFRVVPHPWELEESLFEYTNEMNEKIQPLTYDPSYVDYADNVSGTVYINNRMGRFYFRLGTGKYVAWQASLVGDAAFGFTDENGNFLMNGEQRVSSIRADIDPEVTNNIYVKAVNSSATVTSRAKLRIYYIDGNGDAVAALDLVNMQGVTEWTIVQNAN